ncbi:hypothetical protein LMG26845_05851 [Achromobacter insuavis]|uniref:Uncharacterized protein n=1 Tax=Achromobacter insuavis TaxID=1287735 RepID=A0A6J5BP04_9BURK|nr:hypothetical protein LMG26845_05851 [Achromobacter insuavis]
MQREHHRQETLGGRARYRIGARQQIAAAHRDEHAQGADRLPVVGAAHPRLVDAARGVAPQHDERGVRRRQRARPGGGAIPTDLRFARGQRRLRGGARLGRHRRHAGDQLAAQLRQSHEEAAAGHHQQEQRRDQARGAMQLVAGAEGADAARHRDRAAPVSRPRPGQVEAGQQQRHPDDGEPAQHFAAGLALQQGHVPAQQQRHQVGAVQRDGVAVAAGQQLAGAGVHAGLVGGGRGMLELHPVAVGRRLGQGDGGDRGAGPGLLDRAGGNRGRQRRGADARRVAQHGSVQPAVKLVVEGQQAAAQARQHQHAAEDQSRPAVQE